MDMHIFEKMEAPELKQYLEFLLWHYRVVDAFWFLNVAEHFDQQTAERINEGVWERVPSMAAKDLICRFDIQERGIEGMKKALELFPWCIITGYQFEQARDEMIVSVPSCPTQQARIKRNLNEFACKEMHRGLFTNFAQTVDKRINVECLFAPPDPHPSDMFCKWRFFL
ncbi:MAG: DUF6125 family protein [Chloroflexota bacterium]|nr:DUF6125 family protein [Chloroflexota bacterium]